VVLLAGFDGDVLAGLGVELVDVDVETPVELGAPDPVPLGVPAFEDVQAETTAITETTAARETMRGARTRP
jgi:hypothetical protein